MAFRKRNVAITGSRASNNPNLTSDSALGEGVSQRQQVEKAPVPGLRPSPVDGSPTISTGTPSLDGLLAGHAGLVLGKCFLIEEAGATDYASTLLRYYTAEGVLQGHQVHVIGAGEQWTRELPGLASTSKREADREGNSAATDGRKMKIAWRYERLGEIGSGISRGPGPRVSSLAADARKEPHKVFCHAFDLTKRLELPSPSAVKHYPIRAHSPDISPFREIVTSLEQQVATENDSSVHRIVIPGILSPAIYPPWSSLPQNILRFLHALRSLLSQYPNRLAVMFSLPITLYPREAGLTTWMELLCDGVLELTPFPHTIDTGPSLATSGAATAQEEKPQGMARLHRLPVFHERGGGSAGSVGFGDDLAFTVTRRRFEIKPFSLPPVEDGREAERGAADTPPSKASLEF